MPDNPQLLETLNYGFPKSTVSLRDMMAMQALSGLLAIGYSPSEPTICFMAYKLADGMLMEREVKNG